MSHSSAPLALLALLGLAGCANNAQMRGLATQIGIFSDANKAGVDDFRARYDRYNGQLNDRLAAQDAATATEARLTLQQEQAWKLSGQKGPADQFAVLSTITAETAVQQLGPAAQPVASLDAGNLSAQLATGEKAAAALAKKPTAMDQLRSVIGVIGVVNDTLTTIKAEAAKKTPSAAPKAPPAVPAAPAAAAALVAS